MFNKKYSVTQSKYWKYKNDNDHFNIINFLKEILENIFDIKIIKKKNFNNSFENISYLKSKKIINMRNKELSVIILKFLLQIKVNSDKNKILKLIKLHDNFFYNQKQLRNNYGGIGYNNSLFIYIFYNHLELNLILESGVWKGFTTLLFDQYVKKIKKISFDINFENLKYKSKKTEYVEHDIEKYNFEKNRNFSKTLAFFDDHVSQYDRLLFANKKKIKYLIFDDDINLSAVHSDGWPSIPTISMLINKNNIKKFNWKSIDKNASANFPNKKFNNIVKNYFYVKPPNISNITGYYQQTPMGFLIRK
jgi:hypothetical protein